MIHLLAAILFAASVVVNGKTCSNFNFRCEKCLEHADLDLGNRGAFRTQSRNTIECVFNLMTGICSKKPAQFNTNQRQQITLEYPVPLVTGEQQKCDVPADNTCRILWTDETEPMCPNYWCHYNAKERTCVNRCPYPPKLGNDDQPIPQEDMPDVDVTTPTAYNMYLIGDQGKGNDQQKLVGAGIRVKYGQLALAAKYKAGLSTGDNFYEVDGVADGVTNFVDLKFKKVIHDIYRGLPPVAMVFGNHDISTPNNENDYLAVKSKNAFEQIVAGQKCNKFHTQPDYNYGLYNGRQYLYGLNEWKGDADVRAMTDNDIVDDSFIFGDPQVALRNIPPMWKAYFAAKMALFPDKHEHRRQEVEGEKARFRVPKHVAIFMLNSGPIYEEVNDQVKTKNLLFTAQMLKDFFVRVAKDAEFKIVVCHAFFYMTGKHHGVPLHGYSEGTLVGARKAGWSSVGDGLSKKFQSTAKATTSGLFRQNPMILLEKEYLVPLGVQLMITGHEHVGSLVSRVVKQTGEWVLTDDNDIEFETFYDGADPLVPKPKYRVIHNLQVGNSGGSLDADLYRPPTSLSTLANGVAPLADWHKDTSANKMERGFALGYPIPWPQWSVKKHGWCSISFATNPSSITINSYVVRKPAVGPVTNDDVATLTMSLADFTKVDTVATALANDYRAYVAKPAWGQGAPIAISYPPATTDNMLKIGIFAVEDAVIVSTGLKAVNQAPVLVLRNGNRIMEDNEQEETDDDDPLYDDTDNDDDDGTSESNKLEISSKQLNAPDANAEPTAFADEFLQAHMSPFSRKSDWFEQHAEELKKHYGEELANLAIEANKRVGPVEVPPETPPENADNVEPRATKGSAMARLKEKELSPA